MKIEINEQELATILAALRHWQRELDRYGAAACSDGIHFIDYDPLGADQIDGLCERINCAPTKKEKPCRRNQKSKKSATAI